MFLSKLACGLAAAALLAAAAQIGNEEPLPKRKVEPTKLGVITMNSIEAKPFGKTKDGTPITVYTLINGRGLKARLIDYGATLISLETPDSKGKLANITLGFPNLDGYLQRHPYFGSTVGRYGNRIAGGKFKLDGKEFRWPRTRSNTCTAG
jgi:hypothetical protein